jgi:hypothetical protein
MSARILRVNKLHDGQQRDAFVVSMLIHRGSRERARKRERDPPAVMKLSDDVRAYTYALRCVNTLNFKCNPMASTFTALRINQAVA